MRTYALLIITPPQKWEFVDTRLKETIYGNWPGEAFEPPTTRQFRLSS